MNTENQKVMLMVDKDELLTMIQSAIQELLPTATRTSKESKQIGEYIPQSEAMELLGRKTTWFYLKRKSGELPAVKSANQWWYKRSDIESFIGGGRLSLTGM